jgi:hypothetical protein
MDPLISGLVTSGHRYADLLIYEISRPVSGPKFVDLQVTLSYPFSLLEIVRF